MHVAYVFVMRSIVWQAHIEPFYKNLRQSFVVFPIARFPTVRNCSTIVIHPRFCMCVYVHVILDTPSSKDRIGQAHSRYLRCMRGRFQFVEAMI